MNSIEEVNSALGEFLVDLLSEKSNMSSDEEGLSCFSMGLSDSDISLSSDEEGGYCRNDLRKGKSSKVETEPTENVNAKMNSNKSKHSRRRRQRCSKSMDHPKTHPQRSCKAIIKVPITQDNARIVRSRSTPLLNKNTRNEPSAHSYSSSYSVSNSTTTMGSRNSITNTSINKWRSSKQQKNRPRCLSFRDHNNRHRDSRWSNNSVLTKRLAKTRSCDLGMGSGSLHKTVSFDLSVESDSIQKQKTQWSKKSNLKKNSSNNLSRKKTTPFPTTTSTIDSVVALVTRSAISDDDDSYEPREFYGDEDSFSTPSITSCGTSTSFASTINTRNDTFMFHRNNPRPSTRKSFPGGDSQCMPQMPQRTKDGIFFDVKKAHQRSLSDDCSWFSSSQHTGDSDSFGIKSRNKKRGAILRSQSTSDSLGRWDAMATTRGFDGPRADSNNTTLHHYLAPPRRVPSGSGHKKGVFISSDVEESTDDDDSFMEASLTDERVVISPHQATSFGVSIKASDAESLKILLAGTMRSSGKELNPRDSLRE